MSYQLEDREEIEETAIGYSFSSWERDICLLFSPQNAGGVGEKEPNCHWSGLVLDWSNASQLLSYSVGECVRNANTAGNGIQRITPVSNSGSLSPERRPSYPYFRVD